MASLNSVNVSVVILNFQGVASTRTSHKYELGDDETRRLAHHRILPDSGVVVRVVDVHGDD